MKNDNNCSARDLMEVKDALHVLSGYWKLQILIVLFRGPKRFKEIANELEVSDKVLSKELKDLEENLLVSRAVYETFPPKVEYTVTEHTRSLDGVLNELKRWGKLHRSVVMTKDANNHSATQIDG